MYTLDEQKNFRHNYSQLLIFSLFICINSNAAVAANVSITSNEISCLSVLTLFSDQSPISMQRSYPEEHKYYPKTAAAAEKNRLVIKDRRFSYARSGAPFASKRNSQQFKAPPDRRHFIASLVVSEAGSLYGNLTLVQGVTHHSTPIAGGDAKFAGEVVTDIRGRPLWFSYRSGHYGHGPYRMKLFLDTLANTDVDLSQITISLSDRERIYAGDIVIPAIFFREYVQEDWSGDDVVINFLAAMNPKDLSLFFPPKSMTLEDFVYEIIYFVDHRPSAVTRFVLNQMPIHDFVPRLTDWVDQYILESKSGYERVQAHLIHSLERAISKPNPAQWKIKLLNEIRKRHPDI